MTGDLTVIVRTCEFDKSDGCHAIVCYSGEKCNSRDGDGKPKYVDTETIKEEITKGEEKY